MYPIQLQFYHGNAHCYLSKRRKKIQIILSLKNMNQSSELSVILSPAFILFTVRFNTHKIYILPTERMSVIFMFLSTSSNFSPTHYTLSFAVEKNCVYCAVRTEYLNRITFFISIINQLDAQNFCFTQSLFHASTCFEHMCSSSGGKKCITQPLVSSHV